MGSRSKVQVIPLPSENPRSVAVNWESPETIVPEYDALERLKVKHYNGI